MKIISIVITFNGAKWIDKCFSSIANSSIPIKVLAIDNASTDGTPKTIREKYPQVEVIETGQNLGFGKANNIGLKRVLKEKADYAFLLNQDAWVEKNIIANLIAIHQRHPEFGVLAPLQLNGTGSLIDSLFYEYSVVPCRQLISDLFKTASERKIVYKTNFANAACWLLPRTTIEQIGGFDPLFPHYGEDDDYINRIKFHKMDVGLCPLEIVFHDREERKPETNIQKLLNYSFIRLLSELKNNEMPFRKKSYYYKRNVLNKLSEWFGNNKSHYKIQFEATRRLLKVYDEAINHRRKEQDKACHYLQG